MKIAGCLLAIGAGSWSLQQLVPTAIGRGSWFLLVIGADNWSQWQLVPTVIGTGSWFLLAIGADKWFLLAILLLVLYRCAANSRAEHS